MTAYDLLHGTQTIRHVNCGGRISRFLVPAGIATICNRCTRSWLPGFFGPGYSSSWPSHFVIDAPPIIGEQIWVLVYAGADDPYSGRKRFLRLVPDFEAEALHLERWDHDKPF